MFGELTMRKAIRSLSLEVSMKEVLDQHLTEEATQRKEESEAADKTNEVRIEMQLGANMIKKKLKAQVVEQSNYKTSLLDRPNVTKDAAVTFQEAVQTEFGMDNARGTR